MMGCSPSLLVDKLRLRRESYCSEVATLGSKMSASQRKPLCPVAPTIAPRASLESDASQQSSRKDSFASNPLQIKRFSCISSGSPGNRATGSNRRQSLAQTPEDEPLQLIPKKPQQTTFVPTSLLYSPPEPLELICVFSERNSRVCAAACAAATRIGGESRVAQNARDAMEMMSRDENGRQPHAVVIDARQNHLVDAMQLASQIRSSKELQHIIIIAIVKKNTYVKDNFAVLPFLEMGFNRVMVECVSVDAWCGELLQARSSGAQSRGALSAIAALAAALDKCRDLVALTDDKQNMLFANKSWRRAVGWRPDESCHIPLSDVCVGDTKRLVTSSPGEEWEGPIALKRRATPDSILLPCSAIALGLSRLASHQVYVCDSSMMTRGGDTRGSLHSVRRASLDVKHFSASDGLRRTSLAKLQGLPLEAPITKVITLLSAATEGASPGTVGLVERAVDLLRNCELYSPQMRADDRFRTDDPVASDLIGALLSQASGNVVSSRRSSNDSTIVRSQTRPSIKHKAPSEMRDLLEASIRWEFDIFALEEMSRGRPLAHLGLTLLGRHEALSVFDTDERTLHAWFVAIEGNYHASNTYHNSTHAADVLQAVGHFLEKERLRGVLEPVECCCALLAAAAHDVDHPGTSSAFLVNAKHPLAVLYNDITVLENHHAALTFKLTSSDDRVNIFKNLDRESYKTVRHNIIDMILATEMTKHFEHLAKFVNVFYAKGMSINESEKIEPLCLDTTALSQPENVILVKRMMIKCADVSNASRPMKYAAEWARRIAEEYFVQTDEEKTRGLPVVMPMFDRASCSVPRSQIGFIDFIIIDMMEAWAAFIDMSELVQYAKDNRNKWKEMEEAGITTISDVRRAQIVYNAKHPNNG